MMTDSPNASQKTSDIAPPRSLISRLLLWTCFLALFCLATGFIYILRVNQLGNASKERIADELISRDIDLVPTIYRATPDNPDRGRDGTRFYESAFKLQPVGDSPLAPGGVYIAPGHCEVIQSDLLDNIKECLDQNSGFYEMIDRAASHEDFSYDIDYMYPMPSMLEILGGCRSVSRWLEVKNYWAQGIENGSLAVDSWLGIDRVSGSLKNNPYAITVLAQISIDACADDLLEDMLSRLVLDESQLTDIRDAVSSRSVRTPLDSAIAEELSLHYHSLQDIYFARAFNYIKDRAIIQRLVYASDYVFDADAIPTRWDYMPRRIWSALCPGWYELTIAEEIDIVINDYDMLLAKKNDLSALWEYCNQPPPEQSVEDGLTGQRGAISIWTLYTAKNQVVTTAINIELYRVKNGHWPATIGDLTNPHDDPFTNHSLGFRATAEGVIVYSFGPNGRDDNGVQAFDDDVFDDSDDIAFRLYNPDVRNSKLPIKPIDTN